MGNVLKDNLVKTQLVNVRKHNLVNVLKDNPGNARKVNKVKDEGCHHYRSCKRWTQTKMAKFPVTK